jgi:hypothetical protein
MEELAGFMLQLMFIALTTIVFPALSIIAIGWAREKYGVEKLRKLDELFKNKESLAYRAVQLAFDAIKGPGRGAERLQFAVSWLESQLSQVGIKFGEGELEGFVRAMYVEFIMEFFDNWEEMLADIGSEVVLEGSNFVLLRLPRDG